MSQMRVRLASDPASVPGARRFVTDGLQSWGLDDLADDLALCVTELATNAALHSGGSFMSVVLTAEDQAVRVSVEDDGQVPSLAVVPRADFAANDDDRSGPGFVDEPTTGRGLAIVEILAADWGVEATPSGKRVWAAFDTGTSAPVATPASRAEDAAVATGPLPDGWSLVRLVGCPVSLSLRQDEHLDELVREFQLLTADFDNGRSQALATEIQGLLFGPAHARHTGRQQARLAQQAGHEHVDVEMALPPESGAMIRALQAAVKAADQLCEEMLLLTLASPPEVRELRAWMTEEIIGQVEEGRRPMTWDAWRSGSARPDASPGPK